MQRVPEPEVMDAKEQAIAYARADFSSSNQMFVDALLADYPRAGVDVLDIGCGPADVPIRLARARPSMRITAVDASEAMVSLARKAVRKAGLGERITVVRGRVPGLNFADAHFDAILSKDLLHHLPDPTIFWDQVKRLAQRRTILYVMDLLRPATTEDARTIVEFVSAKEPEILKRDFYNSLLAAFTPDEIIEQLRSAALDLEVAVVSGRHLVVKGIVE